MKNEPPQGPADDDVIGESGAETARRYSRPRAAFEPPEGSAPERNRPPTQRSWPRARPPLEDQVHEQAPEDAA